MRPALRSLGLSAVALAQRVLARAQAALGVDQVLRSGHVFVDFKDAEGRVVETRSLGQNAITYKFRIIVARVLARQTAQVSPATFPLGVEGYTTLDPVFPAYLYIGDGTTPASGDDTSLQSFLTSTTDYPDPAALPLRYPLTRILVLDTKDAYDDRQEAIGVSFEFDIPLGTLREDPYAEATPLTIQEWGLYAPDGDDDYPIQGNPSSVEDPQVPTDNPPSLLARKVVPVVKLPQLSMTIRWEIRT